MQRPADNPAINHATARGLKADPLHTSLPYTHTLSLLLPTHHLLLVLDLECYFGLPAALPHPEQGLIAGLVAAHDPHGCVGTLCTCRGKQPQHHTTPSHKLASTLTHPIPHHTHTHTQCNGPYVLMLMIMGAILLEENQTRRHCNGAMTGGRSWHTQHRCCTLDCMQPASHGMHVPRTALGGACMPCVCACMPGSACCMHPGVQCL